MMLLFHILTSEFETIASNAKREKVDKKGDESQENRHTKIERAKEKRKESEREMFILKCYS